MKLVVVSLVFLFSVGLSSAQRDSEDDSNCIYETPGKDALIVHQLIGHRH